MRTETFTSSRQWFNKIIHTDQPEDRLRILFFILYLISLVYYLIIQFWKLLYTLKILKTHVLPKRVISVGNLTAGGTGKTPTVLALARFFREGGFKVAILSRGYGRTQEHSYQVISDGQRILATAEASGEEAYFLARELSGVIVAVGKNRYKAGLMVLKNYEVDLFILDDGFQHLKLYRHTNILLLDSNHPFSNHYLLPRGGLREPVSSLNRASLILMTRKGDFSGQVNDGPDRIREKQIPVHFVSFSPKCFFNMINEETYTINTLAGKRSLLVSGIGDPKSFKLLVEHYRVQMVRELVFPDHHSYRQEDIEAIYDIAQSRNVDYIITTDKDAVKLFPYIRKSGIPVLILKLEFKAGPDFPWEDLKSGKL